MKTKRVLLLLIILSIIVNILVRGPDFLKWTQTPKRMWFTGQASWFDPWDNNVYFSAIRWGKRGHLGFLNRYDTLSYKPLPMYTFYMLLGIFLRLLPLHLSIPLAFHLTATLCTFVLLYVLWWFSSIFLKRDEDKIVALVLMSIGGGGIGWLFYPRISSPDLTQPGFILMNAFRRPHECMSLMFFLLSLGNFYRNKRELGSLFLLGALFFHPYTFLVFLTLFGFISFFPFSNKRNGLLNLSAVLGVGLIYFLLVGRKLIYNISFSGILHGVQHSYPFSLYILGLGVFVPLLVPPFFTKNKDLLFLKVWLIVTLSLIYLPIVFQKLFIRGIWVAVIILSIWGLKRIVKTLNVDYFTTLLLVGALSLTTSIFIFMKRVTASSHNEWIYIPTGERKVLSEINQLGSPDEGVLASYHLSNIIPAFTGKRVYAGHAYQTPSFFKREEEVFKFFEGKMGKEDLKRFLGESKTKWIVADLRERKSLEKNYGGFEQISLYWRGSNFFIYRVSRIN